MAHTRLRQATLVLSALACMLGCGGPRRGSAPIAAELHDAEEAPKLSKQLEERLSRVSFAHSKARRNLSDVALATDGALVVVSDEGREFAVVSAGAARSFDLLSLAGHAASPVAEIDLEGAAVYGERLVLCGSASLKRKKPKPGADNAARMAEIEPASGVGQDASDQVTILTLAGAGDPKLEASWNLRERLLSVPILAPFRDLPSKDNGIDVEAVAADQSFLYFGLRGPVLRGHALVARTDWQGRELVLSFLDLAGHGVRGLSPAPSGKGMYVLAGPSMDLDGPAAIYAWDGKASVFAGEPSAALRRLVGVPSRRDQHPEAVFLSEGALCVLSDGPEGGQPSCFSRQASVF